MFLILPRKRTNVCWNSMVGRCISYSNSSFVKGHSLVFGRCILSSIFLVSASLGLAPPGLMLLWPGHFSAGQGFAEYLGMWSAGDDLGPCLLVWKPSKKGGILQMVGSGYRICRYDWALAKGKLESQGQGFPPFWKNRIPLPPQFTTKYPSFEKNASNNIVTKWWFKYFSFQIRTWWNDPISLFLHGLKSPPW